MTKNRHKRHKGCKSKNAFSEVDVSVERESKEVKTETERQN